MYFFFFFFSSRRRHTRYWRDWSSDVCSSDLVGDLLAPVAGREQRGLVDHVGQVGAGEPGGAAGQDLQVDPGGQRLAAGVDLEDVEAALEVGSVDGDLAVEAAGAQQG